MTLMIIGHFKNRANDPPLSRKRKIRKPKVKFAKENGNPLQYSCLENSMDRGARWATVHGVAKVLGMTEQLNSNKVKLVYYRRL